MPAYWESVLLTSGSNSQATELLKVPRFLSLFCDQLKYASTVLWALIFILRQKWLCYFYLGQAPSFDRPCCVGEEEQQQQVQHILLRTGQPHAQSASNYSSKEEYIQSLLHMLE